MYYGGSKPRKEYPRLSEAEFLLHAKWMRTSLEVKATKGAYLVMVEGLTQKEAADISGSSQPNVNEAVQRTSRRHYELMEVYGERLGVTAQDILSSVLGTVSNGEWKNGEEQRAKAG